MEETISLKEIAEVIKKRFLLIAATTIGAVIIAALISYFFLTPTYEATSQFIVNKNETSENAEFTQNEIRTNIELINTYNVVIKSPAILDAVIEEMELGMTADELRNKLAVSSEQNSQVVAVTVTDPDQARAATIANMIVEVFQEKIPEIMNVDNVSVLSEAEIKNTPSPVSPKPMLNMAIAFVLGLMIGVGIAFLLEYLDNTIKTEKDIEDKLGIPIMGIVTHIGEEEVARAAERVSATSMRTRGGNYHYEKQKKETV
ncbi:YveK family protein [Thalassobacillus pellis]|uniref:YveK family protein n=1 Tax=Thalassobacillus pellis TaxID=748008 RepID=UPI00196213B4|nr:Wzz/FepE/Etk N-terminal domain-containing protein [Thalassobacillus pellis]MBM7551676.1 capsular polysaccharide biosynthesis protein [Thalassobacillus pellis]